MPIHPLGYRRHDAPRARHARAWLVIAEAGVRALLARRGFVALLVLAWLPFLVRSVQMYAAATLPQVDVLVPNRDTFRRFLDQQEILLFFITVYAGAGLIAGDRRTNALQIYLSKPLTRADYIFGKLAVLLAVLLFVTWLPGVLLVIVQAAFAGDLAFFLANPLLVPSITVFAAVQALTVSLVMLALSSLSTSGRYAGVAYAALTFFSQAASSAVSAAAGHDGWAWISIPNSLAQIGDAVFRVPLRYPMPVPAAVAAVVLVAAVAGTLLHRRVRAVEVVA